MEHEPEPLAARKSRKQDAPHTTTRKAQAEMATKSEAEISSPRGSRKRDILDTFTEMVAERGYDEVSLRDIAEALGMSKGTILHHYGSKDRLLEQVHAEYMRRRLDEAHMILARFSTPTERLEALIFQLLLAQHDDRASTVAFAREIVRAQSDPLMRDVRTMRDEYVQIVHDVIASGMDQGVFRRSGEPRIITLQLFGMCNWMWTWLRPHGRWSINEIADTYIGTFLGGLAPDAEDGALLRRLRVGKVVEQVIGEVADRAD